LLIPIVLYVWQLSLSNISNFNLIKDNFNLIYIKIFVWLSLLALFYHMLAGLRHLLLDMHIGDSKLAGKTSAYIVLLGSFIAGLLLGVYLW
jgi:succinate dehydrogenase / fumarate reductase cytochrome b subunit